MEKEKQAEAEQKYIAGSMTLRALADEMGVPFTTISRWSKAGGWVEKRQQINRKAMKKAVARAVNQKARELARLIQASGEMEKALLLAARKFRRDMEKDKYGLVVSDRFKAGNMAGIVNAIGRQTETRMLISGLMPEADKQKIDLMRRKQELEEQKSGSGTEGVQIVIAPDAEELAK